MKIRILILPLFLCTFAIPTVADDYGVYPPGAAPPVSGSKKGGPPSGPKELYYFGAQPVSLDRSSNECVVKFRGGSPDSQRALVEGFAPNATLGLDISAEGRTFHIVSLPAAADDNALAALMDHLRGHQEVELVFPVLYHAPTKTRLLPTDEIVVKLKAETTTQELEAIAGSLDLTVEGTMKYTADEFVLRLADTRRGNSLEKSRLLYETGRFQWAEPNFIREYHKLATPNDPRFANQWHLNNTGQGGGTVGADVEATNAWNTTTGSSTIVIGVIDDGLEKTHEDLSANLYTNPGEIAGNGIDDDLNGYVDDVNGWDFSNNDNNANPFSANDNHGTAVSGVAAARGNNSIGVTGMCQTCKLLPAKIFSPNYAGDTAAANAIRYTSLLADVLNNSWGGGSPSSALQSAIQFATTSGRGGKGAVVLFASGNSASGNSSISVTSLPAGTHRFRFRYVKDVSVNDGDDTTWLSWVRFADGSVHNFESGFPAGWTTGGNAAWSIVTDPRHSDEGRCFTKAAKAGTITHNQESWLQVVKTLPAGNFLSVQWISGEESFDGLILDIDLNNNGSIDFTTNLISGVPFFNPGVAYPAAYPESIAVGASTNFDCRSYYSQFGSQLAFVAPSNGSSLNLGIETTDRTGSAGYNSSSNYTSTFGGTSSATPLASGIAALLLSKNPSLTLAQVKTTLQNTAEKVGPEPYVSGRNDRYGYGRLNASLALAAISACAAVQISTNVLPAGQTSTSYSTSLSAAGGSPAYTFAITVGSLPFGLSLSSSGLLSGTPATAGNYSFSVRATDANGCSGYKAYVLKVVQGAPPAGTKLYIVTPCRIIDTREPLGPQGGPALANLATRDVQITGLCGIPASAKAVAANVTALAPTAAGFLALFPAGSGWPGNSTMNYRLNKTRANNSILPVSNSGATSVLNNGATLHFIIDVTGYFQ